MGRRRKIETPAQKAARERIGKLPFKTPKDYKSYVNSVFWPNDQWYEPFEFTATMKIESIFRGANNTSLVLSNNGGKNRYRMFPSDMEVMLTKAVIDKGVIRGTWDFHKQGDAYGLRWLR